MHSIMEFSQGNKVIQLCTRGMELEARGRPVDASMAFTEAWNIATTDVEKFTAAHYVARHQQTVTGKLQWDQTALQHALQASDESLNGMLPSLYLNIGKCYEDLNDLENAKTNYLAAFSFVHFLPEDGYGKMISAGIANALKRVK